MRPKLLDLFCGPGGAGAGYAQAGFDVKGIDINPQPSYPFEFQQADAMTILLWIDQLAVTYDAIHASPPCPRYAPVTRWRGRAEDHPDLLGSVVEHLRLIGLPWVVENVPHAPMAPDFVLCGSMFGLPIRRHRWFLTSWSGFDLMPQCQHRRTDLPFVHKGERAFADAMGCDWMNKTEARQAIPPAYTEWIGQRLLEQIKVACPGRGGGRRT